MTATQGSNPTITLQWDSDPSPAVNYHLYTATGAQGKFGLVGSPAWTLLATVTRTAGTTTYSYPDASGQDFVWYTVRAFDGTGEGGASGLGYKVVRHLVFNSGGAVGNINWVGLPPRSAYHMASDVIAALGAGSTGLPISSVALWHPDFQITQTLLYSSSTSSFLGSDFALTPDANPGGGIYVGVSANVNWVIAGADVPASFTVTENASRGNQNWLSLPYGANVTDAVSLLGAMGSTDGSKATQTGDWMPTYQVNSVYAFAAAPVSAFLGYDFPINPGDGVWVNATTGV
ncbi:MAG TPA: hypothetical protein VNZ54_07885, partial [bacterium]|nr:hypothetical protein [bacterium]